jgi:hypothetical protein
MRCLSFPLVRAHVVVAEDDPKQAEPARGDGPLDRG